MFEKEITEISNPELYIVEKVGESTLPLNELAKNVATTLPDSVEITGITILPNPERTYQVNLSKPKKASVYVNPYTGEITGKSERSAFFRTMFKMHRRMMGGARAADGGISLGKLLVGVSTIVFVVGLITGIFLWWPRKRIGLKKRLSINMTKGWKRFWYDLHVVGGFYALILLLAMSLTGLTWSFQWYRDGFYKVFGVEVQQGGGHHSGQVKGKKGGDKKGRRSENSPYLHWQKVYDELAAQNPDFKKITIQKGSASVSFDHWGNQRAADKYKFDPQSGEITETTFYESAPNSSKIRGWIYSVHVGDWGGLITRVLSFLAALLGASLPLTGYYFWFKRMYSKKKKKDSYTSKRLV